LSTGRSRTGTRIVLYLKDGAVTNPQLRKFPLQIVPVFEQLGFVLLVESVPVGGSQFT